MTSLIIDSAAFSHPGGCTAPPPDVKIPVGGTMTNYDPAKKPDDLVNNRYGDNKALISPRLVEITAM
ncbi:MAG: hypothetical protein KBC46_09955 [Ferrovibrio sp.]|nr:hypothetical protein [Ferrovibrio sp.]